MNVTVKYMAQAREAAGRSSEQVRLDGPTTVRELLLRLAHAHGERFASMALDERGCPHPSLLVVVGDDQVRWDDARGLAPGETVTIMTPIAGG